jgi:glutamyl endopeptidase
VGSLVVAVLVLGVMMPVAANGDIVTDSGSPQRLMPVVSGFEGVVVDADGAPAVDVVVTVWRHMEGSEPDAWDVEMAYIGTTEEDGSFMVGPTSGLFNGVYSVEFGGGDWIVQYAPGTINREDADFFDVSTGLVTDLGEIIVEHGDPLPPLVDSGELVTPVGVDSGGDLLDTEYLVNDLVDLAEGEGFPETEVPAIDSIGYINGNPDSPPLFSIIGGDNRVRVTNTTAFPNSAIAYIVSTGGQCTGWIIGPRLVVTAGHCIYDRGNRRWNSNFQVSFGRNGASTPYGVQGWATAWTDVSYINNGNMGLDWGLIQLNSNIGYSTGWFGYGWQTTSRNGTSVTVRGYPGDHPQQLWTHSGTVQKTEPNRLFYNVDTVGGQSGSPVYVSGNIGVAIHAYGVDQTGLNSGTHITEGLFNLFRSLS